MTAPIQHWLVTCPVQANSPGSIYGISSAGSLTVLIHAWKRLSGGRYTSSHVVFKRFVLLGSIAKVLVDNRRWSRVAALLWRPRGHAHGLVRSALRHGVCAWRAQLSLRSLERDPLTVCRMRLCSGPSHLEPAPQLRVRAALADTKTGKFVAGRLPETLRAGLHAWLGDQRMCLCTDYSEVASADVYVA